MTARISCVHSSAICDADRAKKEWLSCRKNNDAIPSALRKELRKEKNV